MDAIINIEVRNNKNRRHRMTLSLDADLANEGHILKFFSHLQLYEPEVCHVLSLALEHGDTFIDVGANAGFFTAMAGLLVGDTGNIIAFEPGSNTIDRLKANIDLNNLDNVTLITNPVSDKIETVNFYLNDNNSGGY